HDRHSVVANIAAKNDSVAGTCAIRGDVYAALDDADSGSCDEYLVALSTVDHFGVAGDELNACICGRGSHRLHHAAQIVDGQALFEDECGRKIEWACPAHREIVDGAMDCATTDIAAWEKYRCHDKRIGCKRHARAADGDDCLIIELVEDRIVEGGQEYFVDQVGGKFSTAAMAQHDLFVLEDGDGTGPEERRDCGLSFLLVLVGGYF